MGVLPLGTESHSNWPRKNDLVTKHFERTIKTADVATILCVPWRISTRFYVTFLQLVIVFGTSVSLFITLYMVFWFSL